MADHATQDITLAGLEAAYAAANAGGDTFTPGENVFIHVKNGGGGAITPTIVSQNTAAGGLAIADAGGSIDAGDQEFFGPFPPQDFARSSDGKAEITWSGVTTVTFAVLKL